MLSRTGPALRSAPQMLGGQTPRETPQPHRRYPLTCGPALPSASDRGRTYVGLSLGTVSPGRCGVRARMPAAPGRAAHLEPLGAPRLDCGARLGPRSCQARRKVAVGEEGREICKPGGLKGARSLPPRVPSPPGLIHGLGQGKVRAPCPQDPWRGWAERGHGRCRVL